MLSDDRGEVIHVEAVGVVAPVPANHVQRMVVVGIGMDRVPRLDPDLELTDLVGLDVRRDILNNLAIAFDDDRYLPHPLLEALVQEGSLGKKTGRGIYDWSSGEKAERKLPGL